MDKTYRLVIIETGSEEGGTFLASTHGDIDVISYVARKVNFVDDKEYTVSFHETDGIGGEDGRRILVVEADAEIVWTMLTKRIRKERQDALPVSDTVDTAQANGAKLDNSVIRAWAKEAGIEHSAQGRLAASVVQAYKDAHPVTVETVG